MMTKRMSWIAGLSILLAQGVLLAQSQPPAGQPARTPAKVDEQRVMIITVKHYPAVEMSRLLQVLSLGNRIGITVDNNTNRLVVRASQERLEEIQRLVAELDVEGAALPQNALLLCRVYMLETVPKDQNLKAFFLRLERPSQLPSAELLDALKDKEVQIGSVAQEDRRDRDENWQIVIEGRAASQDALKRVVERIPGALVKELAWSDETFTGTAPAAQMNRLPAQLQEHLRKFLGDEIQTVGYWFGSLSAPGEVKAPIGPWVLELNARSDHQPGQAGDLALEIQVNRESRFPRSGSTRILSNSVQGKVGKPILIGYNRDSYGTRVMGAVVILPEADTARSDSPGKNVP